jgi:copper chaperone
MQLTIEDMTCGHCASRITQAIQKLDAAANVDIDLAAHRVAVTSSVPADAVVAAVRDAGYTPQYAPQYTPNSAAA